MARFRSGAAPLGKDSRSLEGVPDPEHGDRRGEHEEKDLKDEAGIATLPFRGGGPELTCIEEDGEPRRTSESRGAERRKHDGGEPID